MQEAPVLWDPGRALRPTPRQGLFVQFVRAFGFLVQLQHKSTGLERFFKFAYLHHFLFRIKVGPQTGTKELKKNARQLELIVGKYQKVHFLQTEHCVQHLFMTPGQWTRTLYNQAGLFTIIASSSEAAFSPLAKPTIVVTSSKPIMTAVVKTNIYSFSKIFTF